MPSKPAKSDPSNPVNLLPLLTAEAFPLEVVT